MHLRVGPVAASSALAWIDYGRSVLHRAAAEDAGGSVGKGALPPLEPDVRAVFSTFLDEWEHLARTGEPVIWSVEVPPDRGEFLTHAFYRLADRLAEEATGRGATAAPPEADEFYQALVTGILDALAHEGRATAEFGEQLRQGWPGLKEP